jgi:hypothetical protein
MMGSDWLAVPALALSGQFGESFGLAALAATVFIITHCALGQLTVERLGRKEKGVSLSIDFYHVSGSLLLTLSRAARVALPGLRPPVTSLVE